MKVEKLELVAEAKKRLLCAHVATNLGLDRSPRPLEESLGRLLQWLENGDGDVSIKLAVLRILPDRAKICPTPDHLMHEAQTLADFIAGPPEDGQANTRAPDSDESGGKENRDG